MLKIEDTLAIVLIAFLFVFSISVGFLSPDSMNYLYMADTAGGAFLCSTNGSFNGIYACGYPLLIKIISFLTMGDLFIASKLLNVAILGCSYYIFSKVFSSSKLALLLAFTSFNVFISLYTWSENVILLSFSLYTYALFLCKTNDAVNLKVGVLVLIAILVGCISRYAFAPFSVFMFLSSYLVIGKKAHRLLPYFIIPGLLFILYKLSISQYDMERISAPESMALIVSVFIMACLKSALKTLVALSPFFIAKYKKLSLKGFKDSAPPFSWFFITTGVGYLLVCFTLRSLVQYDFFVNRMVGFGTFLIISGMLIYFQDFVDKTKLRVIVGVLVLTILVGVGTRAKISNVISNDALFTTDIISKAIEGKRQFTEVIVPIGYPKNRPYKSVVLSKLEYDNPAMTLKYLPHMPYYRPMDDKEFSALYEGMPCKLSFAPSLTIEHLEAILSDTYKVSLMDSVPTYHPKLKAYIINKFNSGDTSC